KRSFQPFMQPYLTTRLGLSLILPIVGLNNVNISYIAAKGKPCTRSYYPYHNKMDVLIGI
ncbi:MAG: hypothetical protein ABIS01_11670, partial [Ferruginibacter sp.]